MNEQFGIKICVKGVVKENVKFLNFDEVCLENGGEKERGEKKMCQ